MNTRNNTLSYPLAALGLCLCAMAWIPAAGASPAINPGTPWPAMDALGRAMPEAAAVPAQRTNRFVGIFYFLWNNRNSDRLPNDLAKILPQDPDLLKKPDSPLWGEKGMYYWGEPLYGYYDSRDPWVLRRHAMLLTDAGADVVIFDTTNRRTWAATGACWGGSIKSKPVRQTNPAP